MNRIFSTLFFLLAYLTTVKAQTYSPFGGPFTPQGDLRILVIFAGLAKDCDPASSFYNHPMWPQVDERQDKPACKTLLRDHQKLFYSDFNDFREDASDRSLSNFFFQMSRHSTKPFRLVADFFPERINIEAPAPNNRILFDSIQKKYPDFDWSVYDQRINNPNFQFNNDSLAPDGILDYVVVIWRGPGANGYASLSTNFTFNASFQGKTRKYRVMANDGFTMVNCLFGFLWLKKLFLHELAHSLYNCPHYFGVNGIFGDYFYCTSGWGLLNWDIVNCTANAWESWYLGWIDLPKEKDLTIESGNQIVTLKDFVTTGEAARIRIPGTDQHLWLENHAGFSVFDDRESWVTDGKGNPVPQTDKGLYVFVEDISGSRNQIFNPLSLQVANGLRAISASGNFDYKSTGEQVDTAIFKNLTANFERIRTNPASAHNSMSYIRGNFASDTLYPEMIRHRNFTNNAGEGSYICRKYYPDLNKNENFPIYKLNGTYGYQTLGTGMAFKYPGEKFGTGANPMIVNLQRYDICRQKMEPVILNGLSVTLLSNDTKKGEMTLDIRFDDITLVAPFRLSGNLLLINNPLTDADLIVGKRKTLTLDQSGTPNRHLKTEPGSNNNHFPDFISPTLMTIDSGATLRIEEKGHLHICEGATLYLKKGAKLELGKKSSIKVKKSGFLCIEQGATINREGDARIHFEKNAHTGINPLLKVPTLIFLKENELISK